MQKNLLSTDNRCSGLEILHLQADFYPLLSRSLNILLSILFAFSGLAQDSIDPDTAIQKGIPEIGITGHLGFVIPHHAEVKNLITGHSKGIGFSADWATRGHRTWHNEYPHSRLGIDLFYHDLGNPEQLGFQLCLTPCINLQVNKPRERYEQRIKAGVGIGYTSKIWDLEDNVQSTFISSPLSTVLMVESQSKWKISDKWQVILGMRLTHLSNAAFRMPNLGTNNIGLFAGIIKSGKTGSFKRSAPTWTPTKKLSFNTMGAFGLKEILPPLGKKYLTWTFTGLADYRLNYRGSLVLGIDLFGNESLPVLLEESQGYSEKGDMIRFGITGGYFINVDQWRFAFMAGGYLRNPYQQSGWMYSRIRLSYNFTSQWFAAIALKTHKTVADHIELGIGYQWRQ